MEVTYRDDSFPRVRKQFLIRSFLTSSIALVICAAYFLGIAWYISLLPGGLLLLYGLSEIWGIKNVERIRKEARFVVSDHGMYIDMGQSVQPMNFTWDRLSITKIKKKGARVVSFGVKLDMNPVTFMTFNEDLTNFDEFWAAVNQRLNR